MDEFWKVEKIIRRRFRTNIKPDTCCNIMQFEIATDAMTNKQFYQNVKFTMKRLANILGDEYRDILHSINLMPEGHPELAFQILRTSNCETISNLTLFHLTFLLYNNFLSPQPKYKNQMKK